MTTGHPNEKRGPPVKVLNMSIAYAVKIRDVIFTAHQIDELSSAGWDVL